MHRMDVNDMDVNEAIANATRASAKPSTVLLSGASGMLGSSLNAALGVRGRPVLQLVRHPASGPSQLQWNPAAARPLADLAQLDGVGAAVHLSGANLTTRRWTAAYKRELWTSRVNSTRALAAALASLQQPPAVLVVASAVGIYGDRGDELLDETSSLGTGFLADLCRGWEAAAQPAVEAGIRVVHMRFGVILGTEGGALAKMLPMFRLGLGGRLGSGAQWMSWIGLEDATAAIQFALDRPGVAGAVNVTAPEPVTNAVFARVLATTVHRPAIVPAPAFALRLVYGQMADEALLSSTRAVPSKLLTAGFKFARPRLEDELRGALNSSQ
jgi:uncharacterized protein (TIGR01777 family)